MIAIRAFNLLDVNNGNIIKDPIVIIDDNKIISIGDTNLINNHTNIINLGNMTLLPGLIDCHTHINYHFDDNNYFDPKTFKPNFNSMVQNATTTLMAGFTTIRNMGDNSGYDILLRNTINNNKIIGPRLLVSGLPILSSNDSIYDRYETGVDFIKVFNDNLNFNYDQMSSMVNE